MSFLAHVIDTGALFQQLLESSSDDASPVSPDALRQLTRESIDELLAQANSLIYLLLYHPQSHDASLLLSSPRHSLSELNENSYLYYLQLAKTIPSFISCLGYPYALQSLSLGLTRKSIYLNSSILSSENEISPKNTLAFTKANIALFYLLLTCRTQLETTTYNDEDLLITLLTTTLQSFDKLFLVDPSLQSSSFHRVFLCEALTQVFLRVASGSLDSDFALLLDQFSEVVPQISPTAYFQLRKDHIARLISLSRSAPSQDSDPAARNGATLADLQDVFQMATFATVSATYFRELNDKLDRLPIEEQRIEKPAEKSVPKIPAAASPNISAGSKTDLAVRLTPEAHHRLTSSKRSSISTPRVEVSATPANRDARRRESALAKVVSRRGDKPESATPETRKSTVESSPWSAEGTPQFLLATQKIQRRFILPEVMSGDVDSQAGPPASGSKRPMSQDGKDGAETETEPEDSDSDSDEDMQEKIRQLKERKLANLRKRVILNAKK